LLKKTIILSSSSSSKAGHHFLVKKYSLYSLSYRRNPECLISHPVLTITSGFGRIFVSKNSLNFSLVSSSGSNQDFIIFLVALTISSCHQYINAIVNINQELFLVFSTTPFNIAIDFFGNLLISPIT